MSEDAFDEIIEFIKRQKGPGPFHFTYFPALDTVECESMSEKKTDDERANDIAIDLMKSIRNDPLVGDVLSVYQIGALYGALKRAYLDGLREGRGEWIFEYPEPPKEEL